MAEKKEKRYVSDNAQLMAEWDWERNVDISPENVSWCSGRKVWWICTEGHRYQTQVSRRAYGGGCPYCSGRMAVEGVNDLQTLRPDLAKEWDYERNHPLLPTAVKSKSNKKVWWVCERGHAYEASVDRRARGDSCPYCSNHQILVGFNDLETVRPALAKEWHPHKNGSLKPSMIFPNGNTEVWWQCSDCGYEWKVQVNRRRGCPNCSAKRMTSFPEQAIFYYVSQTYPDAVNRYRFHGFELDVYIPSVSTAIEYDGSFYHQTERAYQKDNVKDELCQKDGIRLIRFRDARLKSTVLAEIIECTDSYRTADYEKAIYKLFVLLNTDKMPDICIDRDRKKIEENTTHYYKGNSLADLYPEIAEQWDYEANAPLDPHNFTPGSNRKISWRCRDGHRWEATINSRTSGTSCPYCAGKRVISGMNDLLTVRPEIAAEWNFEKNYPLTPDRVSAYSNKRVWWKCEKCQNEWQTSISSKKQRYCKQCRYKINGEHNRIKAAEKNNFVENEPEIAKQWHPHRNGELHPSDVSCGCGKIVWWQCEKGHEWQSSILNRVKDRLGCPVCGNQKVLVGYNDFPTLYPELAEEWNYERNQGKTPQSYVSGSGKKVWWKCTVCNSEWETTIRSRVKGARCPKCKNKR